MPSDWSNEKRVLHLLKHKIKETGAASYLPDFPIMKPQAKRVKMRLVLGTNSARGLEVFRDVQAKVEHTEIETRNQLRNSGNNQVGFSRILKLRTWSRVLLVSAAQSISVRPKKHIKGFLAEGHVDTFSSISAKNPRSSTDAADTSEKFGHRPKKKGYYRV